jgi:hypothetical protein
MILDNLVFITKSFKRFDTLVFVNEIKRHKKLSLHKNLFNNGCLNPSLEYDPFLGRYGRLADSSASLTPLLGMWRCLPCKGEIRQVSTVEPFLVQ